MTEADTVLIWGRRPVLDVLRHNPKKVSSLLLKEGVASSFKKEIEAVAKKERISIATLPVREFEKLFTEEVNHQGVAAYISRDTVSFSSWLSSLSLEDNPAVVVFDHLEDVGNAGAVIRTALAAGIKAVLVPKDRQAPIAGALYKSSAGAADRMTVISIGNVADAIRKLKEKRFWVVGLDQDGARTIWEEDLDGPMAFVVGSEGEGIHALVKKECDTVVRIPMEEGIESLNASVSAAIMLYEWKRRKISK